MTMKDYLRKHPDVRTIRVAAADLNGQARGKRVPARFRRRSDDDATPATAADTDPAAAQEVAR